MTRNRTTLLVVVVGLLLGAAFYRFDVQPQRERIAELDTRASAAATAQTTARAAIAAGEQARVGAPADAAQLLRIGRAVPADLDQPALVFQINAAARAAGVAFVSVALAGDGKPAGSDTATGAALPPGAVAGPTGFAVQPLELEFRGTYFALARFTRNLRRLARITDGRFVARGRLIATDSIELEPASSGFPEITAKVKATTYLQPDESQATASTPVAGAAPPAGTAGAPAATAKTGTAAAPAASASTAPPTAGAGAAPNDASTGVVTR